MGHRLALLIALVLLLTGTTGNAGSVTEAEAKQVCRNWLTYLDVSAGAESARRRIAECTPVTAGDTLLAWHFELRPKGYVVVPARRELPPVHASSRETHWPGDEENPFLAVVRDVLGAKFRHLDVQATAGGRVSSPRGAHPAWATYGKADVSFTDALEAGALRDVTEAGPLLTTRWHQGSPFNLWCPMTDGGRTWVGCAATATAQLMRYHRWPAWGVGTFGFQWDGDDCDATPEPAYLEADLLDPFLWDLMPAVATADTPHDEQQELAHLCWDVAVCLRMDFSTCGSQSNLAIARSALMNQLYFEPTIRYCERFRYTEQNWFNEIVDDIDQGNPVLYATMIHVMVCDGWREVDGMKQIHLNYGWGGASDNWYSLDDIETSSNWMAERMIVDVTPDRDVEFPVEVYSFDAGASQDGVNLAWEVSEPSSVAEFWPMRSGGLRNCIPLPIVSEPLTGDTYYEFYDPAEQVGFYDYWLKTISLVGTEDWLGPVRVHVDVVSGAGGSVPSAGLGRPSPNPANPRVTVPFTMAVSGPATLRVLDARGRVVRTLVDTELLAGAHEIDWGGRTQGGAAAASGTYFVRLDAGGEAWTRKISLAR